MPRIENEIKLDFKDVLLRPKRSTLKSREEVDLNREYTFKNSGQSYSGIPIIASNMDTTGTFEMAMALAKHRLFTCLHKFNSVDDWKQLAQIYPDVMPNVAVSAGVSENDFNKLADIIKEVPLVRTICLDVANGYSETFVHHVKKIRDSFPKHIIIAGNVVTGEMVEELILAGADIVKVGIGPGSVCTTRKKAGVGYPQLSAILECADAAHGLGGHIISDGGCTCPGDVAKAFGAGADFVMLGGILAGHTQSGGELVEKNGLKYKRFYGMASETALKKYYTNSKVDYRSSEGKTVEIPYRGDVEDTVLDILGGLRSACTYTGSLKLKELAKRATFIRVSAQVNETFQAYEI